MSVHRYLICNKKSVNGKSLQRHLAVFLEVRSFDEKMPNGRTKTLAGDKGLNKEPGREDAVRRNKMRNLRRLQKKPRSTGHLTRKTNKTERP
jgi:hypothetical protein